MTVCFKKLLLGIEKLCKEVKKGLSFYVYNYFYCNDDELEGVVNFFFRIWDPEKFLQTFSYFSLFYSSPFSYSDFIQCDSCYVCNRNEEASLW